MPEKHTPAPAREEERYVTLTQIAKELRISPASAWSLVVGRREIPYVRICDRIIRIKRSDYEEYLKRRSV